MVKEIILIILIILIITINSCSIISEYTSINSEWMWINGEGILLNPKFTFNFKLDKKGLQIIDTSAIYVNIETSNGRGKTYSCLKFYSNGNFVDITKFDKLSPLTEKDFQVHPNSSDRGKFKLINYNEIVLERFYPMNPAYLTDNWFLKSQKGEIIGDTIKTRFPNASYYYKYIRIVNWKGVDFGY